MAKMELRQCILVSFYYFGNTKRNTEVLCSSLQTLPFCQNPEGGRCVSFNQTQFNGRMKKMHKELFV